MSRTLGIRLPVCGVSCVTMISLTTDFEIERVLRESHTSPLSGHMGVKKTLRRIKHRFTFDDMKKRVMQYVALCLTCQRVKADKLQTKGLLQLRNVSGEPFDQVTMDVLGPLVKDIRGYRYILVLVCYATRCPVLIPLKSLEGSVVATKFIKKVVLRYGLPRVVITDNAAYFAGGVFRLVANLLEIDHTPTIAYHHESNGVVERQNGTVRDVLACMVNGRWADWSTYIPYVEYACSTAEHEHLKCSPFYLVHGYNPKSLMEIDMGAEKYRKEFKITNLKPVVRRRRMEVIDSGLKVAKEVATSSLKSALEKMKESVDKHRRDVEFDLGDYSAFHNHSDT